MNILKLIAGFLLLGALSACAEYERVDFPVANATFETKPTGGKLVGNDMQPWCLTDNKTGKSVCGTEASASLAKQAVGIGIQTAANVATYHATVGQNNGCGSGGCGTSPTVVQVGVNTDVAVNGSVSTPCGSPNCPSVAALPPPD